MSKLTYTEVNDVIKEEPPNCEDNVEPRDTTDSSWEIKLEVEDYNLEDLHHVVDIKDELPFESDDEEIDYPDDFENQHGTKRRLPSSLSQEEIIAAVSKKPNLWNPAHKDYKSENNLSIWQDVAQELGVSGEGLACKAKWDSIQEQYKNLKHRDENRQQVKKCKCTEQLSFLDPYLSFEEHFIRDDSDNNRAAPCLSSSADKNLNQINKIPAVSLLEDLANTKESVICVEKTDDVTASFANVTVPIDCFKTENYIPYRVNHESDVIQTELFQKTADVALTLANQLAIRKYYNKKLILLERVAAVEERRAAVEERRAAVEERRAAAEVRRAAAEERRAAAEERRAAAEERRSAVEEQKIEAEKLKIAAEERRAAVEERRAAAEVRRAAVEERKIAVEERKAAEEDIKSKKKAERYGTVAADSRRK